MLTRALAGKLIRRASRTLDIDAALLLCTQGSIDVVYVAEGPAEPDGAFSPFLPHPAAGLLERHAWHRTAHTALIAEILSLLAGRSPRRRRPVVEPLTNSELRALGSLPANLTGPEIARELSVSLNTVKTHIRGL